MFLRASSRLIWSQIGQYCSNLCSAWSKRSHVAVSPNMYLYLTQSNIYRLPGDAQPWTSSNISRSTKYSFLTIVLNISTLQTEKSWFLANSLFHCSLRTSVGTPISTTRLGFLLYIDCISIIATWVLPNPVVAWIVPCPPESIHRLTLSFCRSSLFINNVNKPLILFLCLWIR